MLPKKVKECGTLNVYSINDTVIILWEDVTKEEMEGSVQLVWEQDCG
jgi:hypothetical protein